MWCVCFDKNGYGAVDLPFGSTCYLTFPLNIDCIGEYELLERGNQAYGSGIGE